MVFAGDAVHKAFSELSAERLIIFKSIIINVNFPADTTVMATLAGSTGKLAIVVRRYQFHLISPLIMCFFYITISQETYKNNLKIISISAKTDQSYPKMYLFYNYFTNFTKVLIFTFIYCIIMENMKKRGKIAHTLTEENYGGK